jgi:hypothetical protein
MVVRPGTPTFMIVRKWAGHRKALSATHKQKGEDQALSLIDDHPALDKRRYSYST